MTMNRRDQNPAERFLMSIFVRLIGSGYLVYIIVKLLTAPEGERPQSWVSILLVVILAILSAVIIFMTLHEFITGLKTGRYKRSTYAHLIQSDDPEQAGEPGAEGEVPALSDDEAAPGDMSEEAPEDEDGGEPEEGAPEDK